MVTDLAWIKRQTYVRDIYCCMSSQTIPTQKVSANGYTWWKGERSKEGALELKSLFLDIDVKKGAYADTEAAIDALQAFMTATGLPRPTLIVLTGGGGLHVHWVLDRALKVAEWLPLANALKNARKQHGLITDEGRHRRRSAEFSGCPTRSTGSTTQAGRAAGRQRAPQRLSGRL